MPPQGGGEKGQREKIKRQSQRYLPCLPLGEQNFLVRTPKSMEEFWIRKKKTKSLTRSLSFKIMETENVAHLHFTATRSLHFSRYRVSGCYVLLTVDEHILYCTVQYYSRSRQRKSLGKIIKIATQIRFFYEKSRKLENLCVIANISDTGLRCSSVLCRLCGIFAETI